MRGLPRGAYTVAITVTTTSGRVLRGIRTYRTCAGKLTPGEAAARSRRAQPRCQSTGPAVSRCADSGRPSTSWT